MLKRLILTFSREGVETRVLYRTQGDSKPGTRRRQREAADLARRGLTAALTALDAGDVEDLGTSGFSVREDVLGLPAASLEKTTKRGG